MPDWLIEILRQFPMVVVIGLAIWYAEKRVREKEVRLEVHADTIRVELGEREKRFRKESREDREAEMLRFGEVQLGLLAVKDAQISNLTAELEKLRKELGTLNKKIQGNSHVDRTDIQSSCGLAIRSVPAPCRSPF